MIICYMKLRQQNTTVCMITAMKILYKVRGKNQQNVLMPLCRHYWNGWFYFCAVLYFRFSFYYSFMEKCIVNVIPPWVLLRESQVKSVWLDILIN